MHASVQHTYTVHTAKLQEQHAENISEDNFVMKSLNFKPYQISTVNVRMFTNHVSHAVNCAHFLRMKVCCSLLILTDVSCSLLRLTVYAVVYRYRCMLWFIDTYWYWCLILVVLCCCLHLRVTYHLRVDFVSRSDRHRIIHSINTMQRK